VLEVAPDRASIIAIEQQEVSDFWLRFGRSPVGNLRPRP